MPELVDHDLVDRDVQARIEPLGVCIEVRIVKSLVHLGMLADDEQVPLVLVAGVEVREILVPDRAHVASRAAARTQAPLTRSRAVVSVPWRAPSQRSRHRAATVLPPES